MNPRKLLANHLKVTTLLLALCVIVRAQQAGSRSRRRSRRDSRSGRRIPTGAREEV